LGSTLVNPRQSGGENSRSQADVNAITLLCYIDNQSDW